MDLSDRRLALARRLCGFDLLHRPGDDILTGELAQGFDVVFDATGSAPAIEAGFPLWPMAAARCWSAWSRATSAFGCRVPQPRGPHHRQPQRAGPDFDRVIAAIRDGLIPTDALLSEVVPLADLPDRFAALVDDRDDIVKILVTP
ncbi:hypothetical protein FLP41_18820 [Paracoccus marcusii]|uniref:hypothetical protein n=1 Tax=Paracoccus marcusii TaxID=59779 RepID=UPI002ED36D2A|nr:hypothetical protein FLP41_18820 [Paracoccus marcusii]